MLAHGVQHPRRTIGGPRPHQDLVGHPKGFRQHFRWSDFHGETRTFAVMSIDPLGSHCTVIEVISCPFAPSLSRRYFTDDKQIFVRCSRARNRVLWLTFSIVLHLRGVAKREVVVALLHDCLQVNQYRRELLREQR